MSKPLCLKIYCLSSLLGLTKVFIFQDCYISRFSVISCVYCRSLPVRSLSLAPKFKLLHSKKRDVEIYLVNTCLFHCA